MIRIALDVMGGDLGPAEAVAGAVQFLQNPPGPAHVVLVGDRDILESMVTDSGLGDDVLSVVHASQVVSMDEQPTAALRSKPDSSLSACVDLQKRKVVQASVSPGNTGAFMAASVVSLGRAGRIARPTVATVLPSSQGRFVMVDSGANVDEKPRHLLEFAVCGTLYARAVHGIEEPRVALLNMGEEESKGTEAVAAAHALMAAEPSLRFVGNVEGHDLPRGDFDVLVTPGFTGNVVLKLFEGMGEFMASTFRSHLNGEEWGRFFQIWSYEHEAGGLLLGLDGTSVILHGRSSARAYASGLCVAWRMASANVNGRIASAIESIQDAL